MDGSRADEGYRRGRPCNGRRVAYRQVSRITGGLEVGEPRCFPVDRGACENEGIITCRTRSISGTPIDL